MSIKFYKKTVKFATFFNDTRYWAKKGGGCFKKARKTAEGNISAGKVDITGLCVKGTDFPLARVSV